MVYEYDQFNRVKNVWAPKEIHTSGSGPTISYDYTLYSEDSGVKTHAVAITNHNIGLAKSVDPPTVTYTTMNCGAIDLSSRPAMSQKVRTATIVDGMGKAAQIHKDQSKAGSQSTGNFLVSGPQTLDKFGRMTQTYTDLYVIDQIFGKLYIDDNYSVSDLMQKNVQYDYNSRPLSSDAWSAQNGSSGQWTTTQMEYGWNTDLLGVSNYFEKTSVLSNSGAGTLTPNMVAANFTDARGRKIGQITYGPTPADNIVTTFEYNEIGELMNVTDPIGEVTHYEYDLAGRVVLEDHPDRGITRTFYDNASNVIEIETPGTLEFGGRITMGYDYNRLITKLMPNSGGMDLYDIQYTYGYKGDGKNGAGRIVTVEQGQTFKVDHLKYDELGQVAEEFVQIEVPVYGLRDFITTKFYDSFGRILEANYPDGDKVEYDYTDKGELYSVKSTVGGIPQEIISSLSYNGYGQISQLSYGNGTVTNYTYDAGNSKKLTTLMGSSVTGYEQGSTSTSTLLDRDYVYNKQGMVSKMDRDVAGSLVSMSGNIDYSDQYTYDNFGRFTNHEQFKASQSIYTLDMEYNKAGGITVKDGTGSNFMNAGELNYNLQYGYNGAKPHQLEFVDDIDNGIPTHFEYNSSGSIKVIDDPVKGQPQIFFWNEEQQLTGVSNDQGIHQYIYDYKGERIMKSSVLANQVYVNDQTIDEVYNLEPYTVYVNPYYVVTGLMNGDKVSKHYYMNTQRVATDITINYDPNQPMQESFKTGNTQENDYISESIVLQELNVILTDLDKKVLDQSDNLELPTIESYYPDLTTQSTSSSKTGSSEAIGGSQRIIFWYHPDYLGNVDLVTDIDGNAYEFFMYNPWGEQMHHWNATEREGFEPNAPICSISVIYKNSCR